MANEIDSSLNQLTEAVIGAAITVHQEFGAGFAEITYHRALCIELDHLGIQYQCEVPVELRYRDKSIGKGRIDFVIENQLVVELKAAEANPNQYKKQVVKYLKVTGLQLGLVINFETGRLVDGVARVALTQ